MNSVIGRGPMSSQKALKLPGRSGMVTPNSASRCSPRPLRSATNRSRSKLMLAPDRIAARFRPALPALQALSPATDRAPLGSTTVRVSANTSRIAAQISSVDTRTTSSTVSVTRRIGLSREKPQYWQLLTRETIQKSSTAN